MLTVGDRWQWTRELADYSAADGWSLAYVLVNAGGKRTITTAGSTTTYTVDVAPDDSALFAAGDYDWQAVVSLGSPTVTDRAVVDTGRITLRPNFEALSFLDARTQARKAVDDLKAALATYGATQGHVSEYEIAGRRMRFRSAGEILELIAYWEGQLDSEEAAQRQRPRVFVRFGRA